MHASVACFCHLLHVADSSSYFIIRARGHVLRVIMKANALVRSGWCRTVFSESNQNLSENHGTLFLQNYHIIIYQ